MYLEITHKYIIWCSINLFIKSCVNIAKYAFINNQLTFAPLLFCLSGTKWFLHFLASCFSVALIIVNTFLKRIYTQNTRFTTLRRTTVVRPGTTVMHSIIGPRCSSLPKISLIFFDLLAKAMFTSIYYEVLNKFMQW